MDLSFISANRRGTNSQYHFIVAAAFGLIVNLTSNSFAFTLLDAKIKDINPNNSTLDRIDPDGASGGRIGGLAAVAGNNQIFYGASEWGGLFKTVDGGRSWFRLDGHLPVATWDIKVDPVNTQTVYATSFYDGRVNSLAGINVSYDGGMTWIRPASATPPPGLCSEIRRTEPSAFGIAIRPDAPENVFIGTNCGVAISRDFGEIWTFVDPTPLTTATNVWDVVVQAGGPNGQGIVDVCGDNGHFRSVDGGISWNGGTGGLPGGRCSIAVSPDESYVLFVVVGTRIFESDDAGMSWNELTNPSPQGRIPFVATNKRVSLGAIDRFDLWFGDIRLWRAGCSTPSQPAVGGPSRCPASSTWAGPFTRTVGAHDDAGDLVFDTEAAIDACPLIFSSDGGVYRNTDRSIDCHNPNWEQPDITPHALWLFAMDGARQPGDFAEDLYFGTQDNGSFATLNAGGESPVWENRDCCDVFDIAADSNRVLYTACCFSGARANRLFLRNRGMTGGGEINTYPPGILPGFRPIDVIDRFADRHYVLITTSGVFVTTDITASPIVWSQLVGSPGGACGVKASVAPATATPTFYVQAGSCDARSGDQLWSYAGIAPGSIWQRLDNNDGLTGGFGIFAVDPNDPGRLYASNLAPGGLQMVFSQDGGLTWENDAELDDMMTGGGVFKYRNETGPTNFTGFLGYPQPSLVAFDPEDPNILVAGGIDSGVFLSTNRGRSWNLLTDPFDSGSSGVPHLPRPWFAYFDHEPAGALNLFIGTQGRGVWKFSLSVLTLVNDELFVRFDPSSLVFDPTPLPGAPAGAVSFTAQFCNIGSKRLTALKSVTNNISEGAILLNRNSATPPAVGSELTFSPNGGYTDLILDGGECVDVFYRVGLSVFQQFEFTVDVLGSIAVSEAPMVASFSNETANGMRLQAAGNISPTPEAPQPSGGPTTGSTR